MRIIFNYRYWVLFALAFTSFIAVLAIPVDGISFWSYVLIMLGTKLYAIVGFLLLYYLYLMWKDEGTISELVEFNDILMRDE